MPAKRRVTREIIVEAARQIVAERGTGALTFQLLASTLGVSKQAIIYWYPSKAELVRDFCLPVLREEASIIAAALKGKSSAVDAIEAFVRAIVAFHLSDLSRFRMVYLWVQFEPDIIPTAAEAKELLDPVHETTSSSYDVLEAAIAADTAFTGTASPRDLAVAVDMAAIGLVTMLAMGEALNDPWKQTPDQLLDALVALLTRRSGATAGEAAGGSAKRPARAVAARAR